MDNTPDANKPVSSAAQSALNAKQDAATAATDAELSAHAAATGKGAHVPSAGLAVGDLAFDPATQGELDTHAALSGRGGHVPAGGLAAGDLAFDVATQAELDAAIATRAASNDARLSDTRTPTDNTVSTTKVQDLAVTLQKVSDLLRTGGWIPVGGIDQTVLDRAGVSSTFTLVSGTLFLVAGITLPAGRPVSSISWMSGTGGASMTAQWACLLDKSRVPIVTTIDDGANAWPTNTVKTFPIATTLGGSTPGAYTPPADIEVYVGILVAGTTPPLIKASTIDVALAAIAPAISGSSSTGLTGPGTLPNPAAALSAQPRIGYAVVS